MARTTPRAKDVEAATAEVARKSPIVQRILFASAIFWLAVLGWFACRWFARPRAPDPEPPGLVQCIAPVGSGARFDEFRWAFSLPPGGWYTLAVYDANPSITVPIVKLDHLDASVWRPSAEAPPPWPEEIEWTVRALDEHGIEIDHGSAKSARRH